MISFTLITSIIALIALGVGLRMIPFLTQVPIFKLISNLLIGLPVVAIAIIALYHLAAETGIHILSNIVMKILEYWYITLIAMVVIMLGIVKKRRNN